MSSSRPERGQLSGDLHELLDEVYETMEGSDISREYSERHGIASAAVLTVLDDNHALLLAERLRSRIEGKTVVEIGGGIGLLAMHLGNVARRVYCIEANPMWSWTFAGVLLAQKPKNVSYLFGAADEFVGVIKADVALYCTHSDVQGMGLVAAQFAPVIIDVYGELIREAPSHFDPAAVALRNAVFPYGDFPSPSDQPGGAG